MLTTQFIQEVSIKPLTGGQNDISADEWYWHVDQFEDWYPGMQDVRGTFNFTGHHGGYDITQLYWHRVFTEGFNQFVDFNPTSDVGLKEFIDKYEHMIQSFEQSYTNDPTKPLENGVQGLLLESEEDNWIAMVTTQRASHRLFFKFAARHPKPVLSFLSELREFFPPRQLEREGTTLFTFWSLGRNGPQPFTRRLAVPTWEEVAGNYPLTTRNALDELMAGSPPFAGGRLLLLHGPPGTGKSHAIRALSDSWRGWCYSHYVVDPDRFFNDGAYMNHVLIDEDADDDNDGMDIAKIQGRPAWKLIIVEDADELMAMDAKERAGQALARLLNTCDGLIGQGLRVLVLITTNEKLGNIHPAIAREGRCAANIEFPPFVRDEANAWLRSHDVDATMDDEATLAHLYSLFLKRKQIKVKDIAKSSGLYL